MAVDGVRPLVPLDVPAYPGAASGLKTLASTQAAHSGQARRSGIIERVLHRFVLKRMLHRFVRVHCVL